MLRRITGGALIALWWLLLLAIFCEIPLRAPLRPAQHRALPGSAFDEKVGRSHSLDDELTIDASGPDHSALQVREGESINAADWRILRYSMTGLPRTLEVSLVYRTPDHPDWQAVSLPWPVNGSASFDLSRVPGWHGEITGMGLLEFPTAQLVPPELGFRPFSVDRIELQSASWEGALSVKRSDWFGYWPWALMSISALGPDAAAPRGRSLVLLLTLGAAGTIGVLVLVFGWRSRRLMLACIGSALIVWVMLDLRWLANLAARHAGTRLLYADKSWDERAPLVADSRLYADALRVRELLVDAPRNAKVFVDAATDYERARLIYHLLPLNTGSVNVTGYGTAQQREGGYLVLHGLKDMSYDAQRHGLVSLQGSFYPVDVVLEDGDLRVYRFSGGARQ